MPTTQDYSGLVSRLKFLTLPTATPDTAADYLVFLDATTGDLARALWPTGGGGGGAPTTAEYLVATSDGTLSAERVATNTSRISWDFGTAGQAKADLVAGSVSTTYLGGDITTAGKALLDDASASAQRTTLGLGGAATLNVGTTAGTVAAGDDSRLSDRRSAAAIYETSGPTDMPIGAIADGEYLRRSGSFIVGGTPAGGSTPTGTGFRKVVSGTEDAAAAKVPLGDTDYVSGTLDEGNGGTGQSSYTTGDILYASSSSALTRVAIGSTGQVLTVESGAPVWKAPTGPTVVVKGGAQNSTTTTLANVTDLSFSVDTDSTYHFRFVLACRTAGATTGMRLSVSTPTFSMLAAKAEAIVAADGTGASYAGAITASDDAVVCTAMPATGSDYLHEVEGIITTTASGTVQLRFGTETGTTQVTIQAGSVLFWTQIA